MTAAVTGSPARPVGPRCRSDHMDLAAHPGSVAPARLRTRLVLRDWQLDYLTDEVVQVVSELVANGAAATRAAGLSSGIRLSLTFDGRGVLVAVWDGAPSEPVPASPDDDSEHGRGLLIVEALSLWQDHRPLPASRGGGKLVRAMIALP